MGDHQRIPAVVCFCLLFCPHASTACLTPHPLILFFLIFRNFEMGGFFKSGANENKTDALKIQSHALYLDTSLSSHRTVLSNIYSAFLETATKMFTYIKLLPKGKKPSFSLLKSTSCLFFFFCLGEDRKVGGKELTGNRNDK